MKEKEKALKSEILSQIINNSERIRWWGKVENNEQIQPIQLKEISLENAQRIEELGLQFTTNYRGRISESKNVPFSFWLEAVSAPNNELPELNIFNLTAFQDEEGVEGRALLFFLTDKQRLYGLARFGGKYDGIKHVDVERGYFALVIFLSGFK